MVLTREIRDQIKGTYVNKVTDSIVIMLERRIAHIEEKLEKIIKENSTVITDIKEEAAILKRENEFLLRKFDDIDQKGSGVVIKEDLSEYRLKLMDAAIEKTSLRRVWSFSGNIFVLHNNKKSLGRI
nr:unnamed protein product [Callosobruchus analis]